MSVKIHDISKSFGQKTILTGFSYDFSDTGVYILRGKSGIGKTTLLRIIAGLDKEYSGNVSGGGIGNVSFAFQEYRLFPELSALENVMLAKPNNNEADRNSAIEMLTQLGFSSADMNLIPSELSGGMKQRVSLARAFLKNTPILLLDEPTKELDALLCDRVCKIIREFAKTRLVILVTHKEEDVLLLDGELINL